jgi:hypothetical protein
MAYTLFGHGSESLKKEFIVPEGCHIFVKALPDQPITHTYFKSLMLNLLAPVPGSFRSITQYTSGQTCPNFVYSLGPEYMKPHILTPFFNAYTKAIHVTEFDLWIDTTLGVIPVPLDTSKNPIQSVFKSLHPSKLKIKELNDYLYANSVFPTREYVHEIFESIWGSDIYDQLEYYDFLKADNKEANIQKLMECNKHFEITQEELCKRFPGTYYNFICRTLRIKKSIRYWIQNKNQWIQNPNIPSYSTAPNNVKRVIRKVIGETELKRKYTSRNTYQRARLKTRKARDAKHESNL